MSGDMRNGGTDQALGKDLEAISAAWQVLQKEEPPDLLDRSVRNAARRALPAPGRNRSLRWLGSLATAAVMILAVAIVIQQDQQGPVPPASRSDGFRVHDAAETESRANDAAIPADEAGPAEIMLQRASPAAASESPPAIEGSPADAALYKEAESHEALLAPEDWIERLVRLREAGRVEELQTELDAFRQAYPGYQLPPDLQE